MQHDNNKYLSLSYSQGNPTVRSVCGRRFCNVCGLVRTGQYNTDSDK